MPAMVIVGAGECGARAAAELRAGGWDGRIELIGAERHLPYERPPLSKAALLADHDPVPLSAYDAAALRDLDIIHHTGVEVTDLDREQREVVLAGGERIEYERVLLATGATPRMLPMTAGFHRAHTLRTHDDALRLRTQLRSATRVTVIGGGFIGLELAAAARSLGCEVTLLEVADRLLGRAVPAEVAALVHARHVEAGVSVRCGVSLTEITETSSGTTVTLGDSTTVDGDILVIGIGAVPETTLAEKTGLHVDNGITVDHRLATSDPRIFAAGDCSSFPHPLYEGRRIRLEAWRNAQDQAVVAAHNMIGGDRTYDAVPWFWSDQYDVSLQVAGLPAEAATEVVRSRPDGVHIRYGIDGTGRLVSAAAVGTGNSVAKDIRLAEMAIAKRVVADPAALADPTVNFKHFLR
ncbi:NAD(P)/FAD-dependent oxidoreductase [Rhodococcus opacus]|uniref:Ferredoxin reductase n=1 Tax=Rhodococcus opacus (strain B4) TaxID=632772 RepID=C1B5R6_RHOOB|nr:FAD-dependent oxidoreductase [Rhodococcus opacus]BAH55327.1 ferredoxin reductase [Rhodococcus opacus B4]